MTRECCENMKQREDRVLNSDLCTINCLLSLRASNDTGSSPKHFSRNDKTLSFDREFPMKSYFMQRTADSRRTWTQKWPKWMRIGSRRIISCDSFLFCDLFPASPFLDYRAYGMNLDGTILQNLVIEAEHEEFLGKTATSNEAGKMHVRVYTKGYVLYRVRKKQRARRLSPGDSLIRKLTFSMDFHHTDNNSGKLQLKFSLLVQVSGKFELEGAIFELFSVSQSESYPSPRVRPPPQPVIPPDFPLDTPPNLRTTSQERPLSAGRSRTGVSSATKGNPETMGSVNASRRHSSPIVTRGRLTEPSGKGRVHGNGHVADTPEPQKVSHVSEVGIRRPVMSSSAASDSTGFGRTISKKFFAIP
ncbi:hypothetical protein DKX38_009567 [Salix brachista]|uniref:Uncharacterized protein n=1 Tax=Salix brachista TaxID=2182728 RepID=A0A5N5MDT0_9ROSI|nr:hypothetical protein DKX38_009567 [Salix brachista]